MKRLLSAAALATVVAGSTALAAEMKLRTIGRASASGDYAIAVATGQAKRPSGVFVRIVSVPRQSVSGSWMVVCSKGFGAGTKSGEVAGRTPLTKRLRLPMLRPDDCTASSTGQLQGSGRVTVSILKTP